MPIPEVLLLGEGASLPRLRSGKRATRASLGDRVAGRCPCCFCCPDSSFPCPTPRLSSHPAVARIRTSCECPRADRQDGRVNESPSPPASIRTGYHDNGRAARPANRSGSTFLLSPSLPLGYSFVRWCLGGVTLSHRPAAVPSPPLVSASGRASRLLDGGGRRRRHRLRRSQQPGRGRPQRRSVHRRGSSCVSTADWRAIT